MKKRVTSSTRMFTCPFCGYRGIESSNPGRWCANCFVKYMVNTDGSLSFDDKLRARSMGEAWAIAIAKSGGMKIGGGR